MYLNAIVFKCSPTSPSVMIHSRITRVEISTRGHTCVSVASVLRVTARIIIKSPKYFTTPLPQPFLVHESPKMLVAHFQ